MNILSDDNSDLWPISGESLEKRYLNKIFKATEPFSSFHLVREDGNDNASFGLSVSLSKEESEPLNPIQEDSEPWSETLSADESSALSELTSDLSRKNPKEPVLQAQFEEPIDEEYEDVSSNVPDENIHLNEEPFQQIGDENVSYEIPKSELSSPDEEDSFPIMTEDNLISLTHNEGPDALKEEDEMQLQDTHENGSKITSLMLEEIDEKLGDKPSEHPIFSNDETHEGVVEETHNEISAPEILDVHNANEPEFSKEDNGVSTAALEERFDNLLQKVVSLQGQESQIETLLIDKKRELENLIEEIDNIITGLSKDKAEEFEKRKYRSLYGKVYDNLGI